ncbi:MAG: gliding motility protein GldL [Chitinophagaceae bacterium]
MAVAIPPKVSKAVDVLVSIAAAIVIWGALRKIIHASDADTWLYIGLTTESIVFLGYGILYLRYPAIDDRPSVKPLKAEPEGNPALKAMEKMLNEADITPTNLSKLSAGFQKLGTTVNDMTDISDAIAATGDYTLKTKEASVALSTVKDAYTNAANSITSAANSMASFNAASESSKVFHEQVQVLTKNLSSLNTIYELELQESNNHLKALNQFYGKLAETSSVMVGSADDAKRAQEQITTLANNLGRLNQVYGNMLSAMQGR